MPAPDKLRILYEDDDGRFNSIGRLPDGSQFMAFVTGAFPSGMKYYSGADWQKKKRWLAVIHRFAADGTHTRTDTRLGGIDIEGRDLAGDKALAHLQDMQAELAAAGEPDLCDIWVRPFSVEIDGVTHGLLYEANDNDPGSECVMLEPCDIMFHPPWDSGEYSS